MKQNFLAGLLGLAVCTMVCLAQGEQVPRFERAACPVPIPSSVRAECGNLFVPENRRKSQSKTIVLPVVIIKSTSQVPAPDPVLYTAGGPGVGSMGMVRGAANLASYTSERDFIIFEQRGTQYAKPSLQCPEVNTALREARQENSKAPWEAEVRAAAACRKRLISEGVDLEGYDSRSSAADIDDLRKVLQISRLNLYGISYSTRLMLNYVRDYGDHVRSMILDSVLPTTANWDETGVDGVVASLNRVFDACSKDSRCSTKYPELNARFHNAVAAANRKPIEVSASHDNKQYRILINGPDIVDLIYNMLENSRELALIPKTIDEIANGQYSALTRYAESVMSNGGFFWGMRYSVWCREEMPFESRKKIAAEVKKYPELGGFTIQGAMPEICRVWNVPKAAAIENAPVKRDIPVLIFGGEYDPDTPSAWGRMVASWFTRGYFIEAPGVSHQVMNNRCTFAEIPAAFLKDPMKMPDTSCMMQAKSLEFK